MRPIVRSLTEAERGKLKLRESNLSQGLQGFPWAEREEISASLSAMLGGFRSMRQEGEDVEAIIGVLRHVLRDFPAWAINQGCRMIAANRAGLDPRWPPNDAQIHAVVAGVVAPFRSALTTVRALLEAPVEPPPNVNPVPDPTPDERRAMAVLLEARAARYHER